MSAIPKSLRVPLSAMILRLLLVQAAQRKEVDGYQRGGERGEKRLGAVGIAQHPVPEEDVRQGKEEEKDVDRPADGQTREDVPGTRAEQPKGVGQLLLFGPELRDLYLLADFHRRLDHVLADEDIDALLAERTAHAELGITAAANLPPAAHAALGVFSPAQKRAQAAKSDSDRHRIQPPEHRIDVAEKLKGKLRFDLRIAIARIHQGQDFAR